jgi:hypothetical protein
MPVSLVNTEVQALTVLRGFLLGIMPTNFEVIRAEINRVPEPKSPDFCLLTPTGRMRLSTNVITYTDGYPSGPGTRTAKQPTQVTVQIDVHGPNSADNAQIISTLLRDEYACIFFHKSGYDIAPLYAGDPDQIPFFNGEQQVEFRWTVAAVLQVNTTITTPQDFAANVNIGITDVDAVYPPGD